MMNTTFEGIKFGGPLRSDLEDSEAELEPRGEDVGEEAAGGDDPAPVALGVVVLPERRRLAVAPQRCKERSSS